MDKFQPRCYPCALRRALCTAEKVSEDPWLQHKVIDEAMRKLSEVEDHLPPAEGMGELLCSVHDVLGTADPWKKQREFWVQEMTEALPDLRQRIADDEDSLGRALLVSARANVFANEIQTTNSIRQDLLKFGLRPSDPADQEFRHDDRGDFEKLLSSAKNLVFVHDTAPELPADLALLEVLSAQNPQMLITQVIKNSRLALNDLGQLLSDSGPLVPQGIVLETDSPLGLSADDWSHEIASAFESADVVILKGASHLQTLTGSKWPAFGLLRAKCPVTASAYQCSIGDLLFIRAN